MEGIAAILKADLDTTEQVRQLRDEYATDREENRVRWQRLTDLLQEVHLDYICS
jgi:predicted DNA binding CopG/RHH family protein